MPADVPQAAAFLLNMHTAIGQREHHAHLTTALAALRSFIGYRLQLNKMEGLRVGLENMAQKDPKHAMLFQTCKFRQDYDEQATKLVEAEQQLSPGFLGFGWDAIHDRSAKFIAEQTYVTDYVSHAATSMMQAADELLEKGVESCGSFHEDDERSWKNSLSEDPTLSARASTV